MRMQSSNPALSRVMSPGRGAGNQSYGPYGSPYGQPGYPQQQGYGGPAYAQPGAAGPASEDSRPMSIDDVVLRTGMVLLAVVAAAAVSFFFPNALFLWGGLLGGLVLGLVISFKQSTNPALIITYGILEGFFLGSLSFMFEAMAGVEAGTLVVQAVVGTLAAFGAMLALYRMRIVRVTQTFAKVTIAALMAAGVLVVVNLLMVVFGGGDGLGIRTPSLLGVGFGLLMIALACAVLAMDFKMIEDGIASGVPNKFAWFCAFGLTMTLVWLYIEIIRLLWMLYAIFSGD
ncbi:Bax inhibitor-1/YccA family protein [Spiractinospora alimapuensis]|nr:Bax inhibitor-1/YccA family protein [Spiractinospora alimapuensis]QVQ51426.1 Bax inhibitor-1/YccA family protein [Spiractinospora alimapuensis]